MIAKPTSPASLGPTFLVPALLSLTLAASLGACSGSSDVTGATTGDAGSAGPNAAADGGAAHPGTDGAPGSPGDDASSPAPAPQATFRTIDTSQYLAIDSTNALTATSASAGDSASFTLTDVNGGTLSDGDAITIAATNGTYLSAVGGGGGALTFGAKTPGDDETFFLVRVDAPGPIGAGDHVALKTKGTGNYVSAINGGGGEVLANAPWDHAWETFTFDLKTSPPSGPIDGGADGSPAVSARQKVLDFLSGISGKQTLIGLEDKDSSNPEADSNKMASMSGNGQAPSFWSGDFGFGSAAQPSSRENIVKEGKKKWSQGAIVQYIYHACPLGWGADEGCDYQDGSNPIKGSYGQLSDPQWADLTTPGGTLNKVWLARLDALSPYFQELKDAGVAPLFRPLHEINASKSNNGGWAWWQGRPGLTGSALLYRITHDYLVKTKGFDNIIWVWNVQDYASLAGDVNDYNPGGAYFDIAGLDVYNTGYTQGNYDAMIAGAGGKPIGIAECQFLPSADVLSKQPRWAYAAMWPDYFAENASMIPALFADPQVIPLSKMPGW